MKKLIVLSSIFLSLVSCSNEDKADQFCGTVVGRGHSGNTDFITILSGTKQKQFTVSNYEAYPMHSYKCR